MTILGSGCHPVPAVATISYVKVHRCLGLIAGRGSCRKSFQLKDLEDCNCIVRLSVSRVSSSLRMASSNLNGAPRATWEGGEIVHVKLSSISNWNSKGRTVWHDSADPTLSGSVHQATIKHHRDWSVSAIGLGSPKGLTFSKARLSPL